MCKRLARLLAELSGRPPPTHRLGLWSICDATSNNAMCCNTGCMRSNTHILRRYRAQTQTLTEEPPRPAHLEGARGQVPDVGAGGVLLGGGAGGVQFGRGGHVAVQGAVLPRRASRGQTLGARLREVNTTQQESEANASVRRDTDSIQGKVMCVKSYRILNTCVSHPANARLPPLKKFFGPGRPR